MNKSSWSYQADNIVLIKPSDYCTHLKAKLSSLNRISSNQGDQTKLSKSNGINNAELQDLVKLGC